jgi:hypothetical protein
MAIANPNYSEHAHPKETTYLLISDSKDIRIGDINIFWHDLKYQHYKNNTEVDVNNFDVHYLWPDVYSHMAFKDEALRNSVNIIINELTAKGAIEGLYTKYRLQ